LCHKCTKLLPELLERGSFHNEGTVSERAARYEAKSNPINKFIEDNCISDVNEKIPYWFLYDKYIEHCNEAGHRMVTKKEFTNKLKSSGFEAKQSRFNKDLAAMYKDCDSNEITDQPNWMAIFGISWDFRRGCRRSKPE